MKDIIASITSYGDAFRWILFLCLLWAFYRVVENADEVEWIEFITTKGSDDKLHPDWDKVGKGTAVVIGSWVIVAIAPNVKSDFTGFAAVLLTYFTFAGAIAGWAAYLRSKSGLVQTTTVTEPAPTQRPTKTTTTTTEPVASVDKPVPVEIVGGAGVDDPLKVKEQAKKPDNPDGP